MDVLVVNAGSSSLKLSVLGEDGEVLAQHHVERWDGASELDLRLPPVDAVGHRVVHGGSRFTAPVVITPVVRREIAALTELAPLHQPRALAGIDAALALLPDVPHVACFDTAFHRTLPAAAATYPLPGRWRARWDLRRYGFHGLSHAYASRRAAELAGLPGARVVSCHLGAGCSLAAVRDGRSVDTTMGFTPLAGLPMATRSGDLDPGLLLRLLDHLGAEDLADGLAHRSGLVGLSGHADMRDVHAAIAAGSADARLALEVFTHRLRQGIAAMAASLGGLDLLVFTGGIGEHDPEVRARVLDGLAFLGLRLDRDRNDAARGDARVTADASPVPAWVVEAREDVEIAAGTRRALDEVAVL
ncbi:acetate/propionate family kinase [Saccharothrix coeruleofusca]|uniref:Acetate kinase n=1 Tax=Saccharothrix coeruleofusca TaxID=33919 RepID=A0A918AVB5_9PSEU|nr:acetate/propionate family kinase [Saccharothrix coeruleofusca]MBP2335699.1 acetate kinase [Saccharothrix coeruleofusca]GGP75692.1 acetate kinase [Saccharothrix coeruleofusca]